MIRSVRRLTVTVAAASLLAVGMAAAPASAAEAAPPTELFISEYVEGSSNNKAIEIANLTGAPVDLAAGAYAVKMYFNGNPTSTLTINLTGTVAAGDVHVVAQASANAAILAQADQTNGSGWFNGDDTIVLVRGDSVIDAFGQVGFDPGTEWGSGLVSTADNTLRRADAFCAGDTNQSDAFDPSVEWDGFATDTFDGLGAHTATCETSEPEPPVVADCEAPVVAIGSVQGAGDATPVAGQTVRIEGVVVGDFQGPNSFNGYYLQDAGDGDDATSDGIFVLSSIAVAEGDVVHVVGTAGENFGSTRVTAIDAEVCATGADLPAATEFTLPAEAYEPLEGMRVTLPQSLAILEYFNYGRFGEIALGVDRQFQPTAVFEPGSSDAVELAAANLAERITLDDGRSNQNPDPAIHPNGDVFTLENTFRGGDLLTDVTGILDFAFGLWRIQPTQGADYEAANPRPDVPQVGGNMTVASFNVLNYFTTLAGQGGRGADTVEEFERQEAKIVAALAELDADVVGLIEIENDGEAVGVLVDALNTVVGAGTYAYIDTGIVGTDAITTALIYKPEQVQPAGDFATLTTADDPRFLDDFNRPALAQTFTDAATGGTVTVVVNHLKSKGSDCNAIGDPDTGDGQGNCNLTRTAAAEAMADWLAGDPTGQGAVGRELIIGDLNAYDKEDPIAALTAAGYTDLLLRDQGEFAYSYVFDGQLGYLDYALAGTALAAQVTGAAAWAINADEPSLIDYDMSFKQPAQDALFAPDPYRSSDHDPIIVGLDFVAPELTVTPSPSVIFPPNNMWRTVTFDIEATDDSGGPVSVEIVETQADGHKAEIRVISDTEVEVRARQGAVYTVTFEATDPSGNTTTEVVTIRVVP